MLRVLSMMCLVFVLSCQKPDCRSAIEPLPVKLKVERLETDLFQSNSVQDIENLLNEKASFARLFLDADDYPDNRTLAGRISKLLKSPSIDTLYLEANQAFENMDHITSDLETALGRLKVYYSEAPTPFVQTVVTGLYKDLVITNDEIIIGLDFFIGENASYPPQQIPDYILRRYNAEHLPANIIQFISSQFIQQTTGESMLAEMIDHGKSYYLMSKLLPCTPEHILMGYTEREWKDSFENSEIIWASFIENELLYETNHQMKQKFLGERPNVYEIGNECPGRIGRWLGWQIVDAYAKNTGIEVRALMAEKDANKILRLSEYKPQ